MKLSVIINGVKIATKAPDLDGDGQTGGIEEINKFKKVLPAKESTELGEAIMEFNRDDVSDDRLSSIDFRSRIDPFELTPMVALDSLIGMGIIPVNCGILNRVKMRKSVSIKGQGRKEFVDIVTGKRDFDEKSLKNSAKNFVGMGTER